MKRADLKRTDVPDAIVVMGVSGSGKSTVGKLLADELGWPFLDSDDLHAPDAIAQMRNGLPLNDAQRQPWLQRIGARIDQWRARQQSGVIACSALKRSYREILAHGCDVWFVYLHGSEELIRNRMAVRSGHFMPETLLQSQFAALEIPTAEEEAIAISIEAKPDVLIREIRERLGF